MISCEGELRNGKKYAELAYFMTISGNSGVQKRMAFEEKKEFPRNFSKKEFPRNLQKVFPPKLMIQKYRPKNTDTGCT